MARPTIFIGRVGLARGLQPILTALPLIIHFVHFLSVVNRMLTSGMVDGALFIQWVHFRHSFEKKKKMKNALLHPHPTSTLATTVPPLSQDLPLASHLRCRSVAYDLILGELRDYAITGLDNAACLQRSVGGSVRRRQRRWG